MQHQKGNFEGYLRPQHFPLHFTVRSLYLVFGFEKVQFPWLPIMLVKVLYISNILFTMFSRLIPNPIILKNQ